MNELTLKLTLEECNALLEALGSQSFKQVHQLIAKIQTQATSQLESVEKPTTSNLKASTGDQQP